CEQKKGFALRWPGGAEFPHVTQPDLSWRVSFERLGESTYVSHPDHKFAVAEETSDSTISLSLPNPILCRKMHHGAHLASLRMMLMVNRFVSPVPLFPGLNDEVICD